MAFVFLLRKENRNLTKTNDHVIWRSTSANDIVCIYVLIWVHFDAFRSVLRGTKAYSGNYYSRCITILKIFEWICHVIAVLCRFWAALNYAWILLLTIFWAALEQKFRAGLCRPAHILSRNFEHSAGNSASSLLKQGRNDPKPSSAGSNVKGNF